MTKLSEISMDMLRQINAVRHFGEYEDGFEAALIQMHRHIEEHEQLLGIATMAVEVAQRKKDAEIEEAKMVLSQEVLGLHTVRPTESLSDIVKDVLEEIEELKKEIRLLVDESPVEFVACVCEHECSECECSSDH
ncbi:hypothetical protein N2384_19925 [Bacillus paralicheniformis]|uniref:hypothetical protein n=1 Tax=Bacillus paralicheniformis TaxID=1648923 RepID=UPI0021A27A81|nr:hypothetical protein [Bacillus paralicheniformis]UWS60243.1 hypothetical protein N2384_19925 [Bacillus paralicheniformis]